MGRGSARTRLFALAAVVGLGLTACGGGGISDTKASGSSDCGNLRIAVNPWTGYVANAHVIGQIATEKLGCTVTYPEVKEEVGWQGDALEAQAFAYLAVRSRRGLPLSLPGTTGVARPTTGGRWFPRPG